MLGASKVRKERDFSDSAKRLGPEITFFSFALHFSGRRKFPLVK